MNLALVLHRYFPHGGLQRDFLRIAHACARRGHRVTVLTNAWRGELPPWLELSLIDVSAVTNHGFDQRFAAAVQHRIQQLEPDLVLGFNRMASLDLYFAADPCFVANAERRGRGWWYRQTPRYRSFAAAERALMDSAALILTLTHQQIADFRRIYAVPTERFYTLPPGIARDRAWSADAAVRRQHCRQQWGIASDELLLLTVASGFHTKGVDRALRAVAALPDERRHKTWLFVVGDDNKKSYLRLAERLGVAGRVRFWGGRDDVPDFMFAADLLLHPARSEAAGMVLLEAVVAGLPVLTTAVCGYAHFIEDAGCGEVLPEPFDQRALALRLDTLLGDERLRHCYREAGVAFGADADIYDMPERVAQLIETLPSRRKHAA